MYVGLNFNEKELFFLRGCEYKQEIKKPENEKIFENNSLCHVYLDYTFVFRVYGIVF